MTTQAGQKWNGHVIKVKNQFVANLKDKFLSGCCYSTVPTSMFINMDETAVFLKPDQNLPYIMQVHVQFQWGSGSSNRKLTACVSIACDGTKLPLFLIFKGKLNERIEMQLETLLPPNIFGCCQGNEWMDTRSMKI